MRKSRHPQLFRHRCRFWSHLHDKKQRCRAQNFGHGCPFSGVPCPKRLSCKWALYLLLRVFVHRFISKYFIDIIYIVTLLLPASIFYIVHCLGNFVKSWNILGLVTYFLVDKKVLGHKTMYIKELTKIKTFILCVITVSRQSNVGIDSSFSKSSICFRNCTPVPIWGSASIVYR